MSYILEALKKSEQKRKRETVPGLQTIHESEQDNSSQKKALWPWMVLAALCINAVILLVFYPSGQNDKTLTPSEAATEQQSSNHTPDPDSDVSSSTSFEAKGISVTQPDSDSGSMGGYKETGISAISTLPAIGTPTSAPAGQSTERFPAIPTLLPQQTDITSQPQLPTAAQKEKIAEEPNPAIITEETTEEDEPVSAPIEDLFETDKLASLSNNETTGAENKGQDKKIPLLGNIPRSIRAELPELSISFHVYAQKPKSRLVSINGRVLREGQSVAEGLTVEEITSEGVILNFNGELFKMEVF